MAKLTLHVEDGLIAAAKGEAAQRKTSLSRMVSDYFRAFAGGNGVMAEGTKRRLPPVTSSLLGCLEGDDTAEKDYLDYLEKKHS